MGRLVELVSPVRHLLPEVEAPLKRIAFRDKLLWSAVTLIIYLICSQVQLYGSWRGESQADPLFCLRDILASKRGTLMELGVQPVLTSAMFLHLLLSLRLIDVNMSSKTDRELFIATQKLLTLVLTLVEALVCLYSGLYGPVALLGTFKAVMIVVQLLMSSVILLLLDELIQKGYGLGNGVSLFVAVNVCQDVFAGTISPISVATENGMEYEGAVLNALNLLWAESNKIKALKRGFFRADAANLFQLIVTVLLAQLIVFIHVSASSPRMCVEL